MPTRGRFCTNNEFKKGGDYGQFPIFRFCNNFGLVCRSCSGWPSQSSFGFGSGRPCGTFDDVQGSFQEVDNISHETPFAKHGHVDIRFGHHYLPPESLHHQHNKRANHQPLLDRNNKLKYINNKHKKTHTGVKQTVALPIANGSA